jgi:2-octaprenylphenol hydroxylase
MQGTGTALKQFDVCIIGGGLTGLSLAALLSESDLSIAIVEQSPLPVVPARPNNEDYALRVSAINLASMRLFQHLGIKPALLNSRASAYRAMQIWDANSEAHIEFDADDIDSNQLGLIIENNIIINTIYDILKVQNNVSFYTDTLQNFALKADSIEIELENGLLDAQLLVGADGQFSKVRTLAKIPTELGTFKQTALVCRIQTELSHRQTAYQCFHHSGPIAYLPLADGSSSIVWSCDTDKVGELQQLDDASFAAAIEAALQSTLGEVQILGPRGAFPLAQQHASRYIDSRIALIGDAAHRTHPLAGLGANLGLQDAATLAETLQAAQIQNRPLYSMATLRKYERTRKHQNALVLDAMAAFKSGFASRMPGLTALRELALNSVDKLPFLKTLITQLATGVRGDLPEVCRPSRNFGP